MKKLINSLAVLFVLLSASACQDVVQVDLEEGAKKYVIDAFVNDLQQPQKIRVLTNNAYFSTEAPTPVTGAQVTLTDLNTGALFTFVYEADGYYVYKGSKTNRLALLNHQFELRVVIDGVAYTSLATQKRTAIGDTILPELVSPGGGGFGPPSTDSLWMCSLSAFDITDKNTDYYWVKTFRNDSLQFSSSDINISIDGTNGPVAIEGVPYTAFTPPITFLGFEMFRRGNTCRVEIHSISRDTYFFFVQARNQINNAGLFATTPENIKTNILTPENAVYQATGWFNVASVATVSTLVR